MLKLLIADDEYLVLDYLKMIISRNATDISIIGTASTGREVIEKAMNLKPDIIFMDIHMPGIDGIEAIRQIKNANSDILFVILTAYEFFDYAKDAISLGVFEYLLKPVSKSKLIETLNNIRDTINKKRSNLMREVELKERINKTIPFLEQQFIFHRLFNIGDTKELEFYENTFDMKLRQGYAVTVLFEGIDLNTREGELKLNFEKQKLIDIFSIKLKCITPCIIGKPLSDRIIAFIPVEGDCADSKYKPQYPAKKLIERLNGLTELNYRIGIGKSYDLIDFTKSCNEAYIAATLSANKGFMYFEDIDLYDNMYDTYPLHKESSFSNSLIAGNIKDAKESFEEIYLWLSNIYSSDIDRIKSKLIDLLFIVEKALNHRLEDFSEIKQSYILNILKINNKEQLRAQFIHYLSEIASLIKEQRKSQIDGIIPVVLKYLNENYNCNITLNDAAKSVNLSYHYFSKTFKDEIGKSFTDYLTELRIEKSIKLLENPNTSIKEICHKIGYNDPNYYCKTFKKITGMTPTEYRSFMNIRGDNIG